MERKTLAVGKKTQLHITEVPGDLRLTGWKESQIKAKTNGNVLELVGEGELVTLTCDNDLILSVPDDADIEIDLVGGDASLRVLDGGVIIKEINGDLALRKVGSVSLDHVSGDLVVRHASGALRVEQLDGDASVRDIQGDVTFNNIEADLHIRDLQASLTAIVEGDVIAYLHPKAGLTYTLQSESDILLRLPAEADAEMTLSAGADLSVNLLGVEEMDGTSRSLTLGAGSAKMDISASGDLLVTSQSDDWAAMADFDISLPFIGADFPGLSDDFGEELRRKADEAARKAEKAARKIEERVMRQSSRYIRDAERHAVRAARSAEHHIHFGKGPKPPRRPRRPMPPDEPVSDTERLLILKMLEEKKITAADAEKLLAALE